MIPTNPSGNCSICGIPVGNLFLDSGKWKCVGCCNPQIIKNLLTEATQTSERGILK